MNKRPFFQKRYLIYVVLLVSPFFIALLKALSSNRVHGCSANYLEKVLAREASIAGINFDSAMYFNCYSSHARGTNTWFLAVFAGESRNEIFKILNSVNPNDTTQAQNAVRRISYLFKGEIPHVKWPTGSAQVIYSHIYSKPAKKELVLILFKGVDSENITLAGAILDY